MAGIDFTDGVNALRVNTDVLLAKAADVEQKVKQMKAQFSEMERMIEETKSHWQGEAGDLHRNIYYGKKEQIDSILTKLAQHPVNLREAAKIYAGLSSETDQIVRPLPDDVIS